MNSRMLSGLAALALLLGGTANVKADIITPAGLKPGDQFRIVFVTTTSTFATSSDLTGHYDPIVSGDAAAAGINTYNGASVLWQTIGSTSSVNAVDRLPKDAVPIFLPDGTRVADSGMALWNTTTTNLLHDIDEFANGQITGGFTIWTGTSPDGTSDLALGSTPLATIGDTVDANQRWVDSGAADVGGNQFVLYGFSAVLTVPQTSVIPEPGTFTLMLLGIGGLVGARLTRRRAVVAPG